MEELNEDYFQRNNKYFGIELDIESNKWSCNITFKTLFSFNFGYCGHADPSYMDIDISQVMLIITREYESLDDLFNDLKEANELYYRLVIRHTSRYKELFVNY